MPTDTPLRRVKGKRRRQPEHQMQRSFFQWVRAKSGQYPALRNCYAVPNGGARSVIQGSILRAEGVTPGVPDVNLDWPGCGYHGLRIEFKADANQCTPEQKLWHERLRAAGYHVVVCRSWEMAVEIVEIYLKG